MKLDPTLASEGRAQRGSVWISIVVVASLVQLVCTLALILALPQEFEPAPSARRDESTASAAEARDAASRAEISDLESALTARLAALEAELAR